MDGYVVGLIITIIDIYIVLLFVRMFATTRERYDAVLGMVFKATDPVVGPLATTFSPRTAPVIPLLVIIALLLLKGVLLRSIPQALQSFADRLLQLYVLLILIIAAFQEYYINPIANFGQRLVRPVRTMAERVARQPVAVHLVSVGGLIILHTVVTLVLAGLLGGGVTGQLPVREAFIYSLSLIVDLTWFFIIVIFINSLLSWVSPDPLNPIVQLLTLIAAPIIEPIRRIIPPLGGMIDISPLIAFFGLLILNEIGHSFLRLL
jgi:YggT family protein